MCVCVKNETRNLSFHSPAKNHLRIIFLIFLRHIIIAHNVSSIYPNLPHAATKKLHSIQFADTSECTSDQQRNEMNTSTDLNFKKFMIHTFHLSQLSELLCRISVTAINYANDQNINVNRITY